MLQPLFNQHDDHFQGNLFSPLELVVYADFQSHNCGDSYTVVRQLRCKYGDKLKVVYRHLPLITLHPLALEAAIASEAAALDGKFWQMHDLIYENQKYLTPASFRWFADEISISLPIRADGLVRSRLQERVMKNFRSGISSGVEGLPGYFINRQLYTGFNDFKSLCTALDFQMDKMRFYTKSDALFKLRS